MMKITRKFKNEFLVMLLMALVIVWFCNQYNPMIGVTRSFTGRFVGFQYGDYRHAVFETDQGEIISVFTSGEECFLALNMEDTFVVKIGKEKRNIREIQSYYKVTIVRSLRALSSDQYWVNSLVVENEKYAQSDLDKCSEVLQEYIYREISD